MLSKKELWRRFKNNNDKKAREKLIIEYLDLVKYQASRVKTFVSNNIELEDLESYGIIGLIDAIEKFDPNRGYKFNSYAQKRIRGEIIDQLRNLDWLPHSMRYKAKIIKTKAKELEKKLQRKPNIDELVNELDFSKKQITHILKKLEESQWVSIYSELNGKTLLEWLPDNSTFKPEVILDEEIATKTLKEAIEKLKDRERLILSLIYYEELNQKEVAEVLDLSPARVSQIHKKIVFRLRGFLSNKKQQL